MKKFTRFCLVLGLVLCLCGGAAAAAGAVSGAWREVTAQSAPLISRSGTEGSYRTLDYAADAFSMVELQLSSEDVSITASKDGMLHIRYLASDDAEYQTRTESGASGGGDTLVFSRNGTLHSPRFSFGFHYDEEEYEVLVELPAGLSLSILTGSGDVTVTDVSAGVLAIAASSGDVTLQNCRISGSCTVGTTSGELELENLTLSAEAHVESASGDLELSHVACEDSLSIFTTSGELELENLTVSGDTSVDVTSGDVSLSGCALSGDADLTATSGDISGSAVFSGDVTIQTQSGDIELNLSDSPAHALGDTQSQSGTLDIQGTDPDGSCVLNVTTASGDVQIRN